MSALLALSVLALGAGAGCLANARLKMARLIEEPSPAEVEDAARIAPEPSRAEQIEAVQALCFSSEPYVMARLAPFEAEVSEFAELLLELDDQSPKPTGPYED